VRAEVEGAEREERKRRDKRPEGVDELKKSES
jgi:hypothetical protein